MNLLNLLLSLFKSKKPDEPTPTPAAAPVLHEPEDVPPPPLLPLSILDILTSSGQYPDRLESPECTPDVKYNAAVLVSRVNPLLRELGFVRAGDVKVNSGFRTLAANKAVGGAPASSHLKGRAVDLHDPLNTIEGRITDELLEKYNLYREAPGSTRGWVHLDTKVRATRTFQLGPRVVKT